MPRKRNSYEVMVVPVSEDAFAAARKLRMYAIPISMRMSDVSYIAFYRGAPTSAITHYAKVTSIDKNVRYKDIFPSGSNLIAPDDQLLKVYRLDEMVQFRRRVKMGWSPPVTRARYADIKTLRKARYLDEVWPKEEMKEARQPQKDSRGPPKGTKEEGTGRKAGKEPRKKAGKEPRKKAGKEEGEDEGKAPKKKGRKRASRGRKERAKEKEGKPEKVQTVDAAPAKVSADKGDQQRKKRSSRRKRKAEKAETDAAKPSGGKPKVHYIVDGSNVALEARTFKEGGRLRQLELLMEKLSQVKGSAVTVIVDANLRHHVDRKDELERMIKDRTVLQAPAQTDADEFILMTGEAHRARGEDVVIISNDRYQDYIRRYQPRFDWVKRAQQQFMFVFSPDGSEVLEAIISMA